MVGIVSLLPLNDRKSRATARDVPQRYLLNNFRRNIVNIALGYYRCHDASRVAGDRPATIAMYRTADLSPLGNFICDRGELISPYTRHAKDLTFGAEWGNRAGNPVNLD